MQETAWNIIKILSGVMPVGAKTAVYYKNKIATDASETEVLATISQFLSLCPPTSLGIIAKARQLLAKDDITIGKLYMELAGEQKLAFEYFEHELSER